MSQSIYTVSRSGATTTPLTVYFSIGGTATYNVDYTIAGAATMSATSGSIIIPIGQPSASMTITTVPDSVAEGDESIAIAIISNPQYVSTSSALTLTITDDDGGGGGGGGNLSWASNGDSNGVIYYIGSQAGAIGWSNPFAADLGLVASFANSAYTVLTDRSVSLFYTDNVANSWIVVDLGKGWAIGKGLALSEYTIRGRSDFDADHLRNWQIQGTNLLASFDVAGVNSATWTTIDTRSGDLSINALNAWGHWVLSSPSASYRYFRLLQVGANSSGNNYLTLGEIELYGNYL